jgi:hypothetical protein
VCPAPRIPVPCPRPVPLTAILIAHARTNRRWVGRCGPPAHACLARQFRRMTAPHPSTPTPQWAAKPPLVHFFVRHRPIPISLSGPALFKCLGQPPQQVDWLADLAVKIAVVIIRLCAMWDCVSGCEEGRKRVDSGCDELAGELQASAAWGDSDKSPSVYGVLLLRRGSLLSRSLYSSLQLDAEDLACLCAMVVPGRELLPHLPRPTGGNTSVTSRSCVDSVSHGRPGCRYEGRPAPTRSGTTITLCLPTTQAINQWRCFCYYKQAPAPSQFCFSREEVGWEARRASAPPELGNLGRAGPIERGTRLCLAMAVWEAPVLCAVV